METVLRPVTIEIIKDTIAKAEASPRKRAHYLLHQPEDLVQRMVNAIVPGSYVPPHKHENPDKIEVFSILVGRVACLKFTPEGKIDKIYPLEEKGSIRIVDIRPRIYHSFIALEPSALLEIIQGPYHQETHKFWPDWAPKENTPEAVQFLQHLEEQVHQYLNH